MDVSSRLDTLLNQCRSNDVDAKVDALTKLQAEFENGIEIRDPDAVITVIKICLRTSNIHLTAAAVSAIPPLIPLLTSRYVDANHSQPSIIRSTSASTSSTSPSSFVDVVTLRQLLNAFIPAGGIIDRLGDKERIQHKAREALVILGGLSFRAGPSSSLSTKARDGKGLETPLMIFERHLKEAGLKSKVWKVREQSILTVVHIRRAHHIFPIRPYISYLVDALEDTDAHVRDCARQSVIELFTGPAVTDAARADLKKELAKKNVRKAIVDAVLSRILGGSSASNPQSESSENGDVSNKLKEYVPPSLLLLNKRPTSNFAPSSLQRAASQPAVATKDISRPASRAGTNASPTATATPPGEATDIQPVYKMNLQQCRRHLMARKQSTTGPIENARFREFEDGFIQWSLKTLASLRTTVAVNTCHLYSELAAELEAGIDPFSETMLTHLLRMASFTKRITAQQSQASVGTIIRRGSAQPRLILPLLWGTLQEKNAQARSFAIEHIKTYVDVHAHRAKHAIETSGGLEILEKFVKKGITDPNPTVKEKGRSFFWVFNEVWHERALPILESLDSIARKQLEKACPTPSAVSKLPPSTPAPKKSSIAAAIAASRAKAKAIATSPPSLRHQATSASQSVPARRSASPTTPSKTLADRPASPLRMSTSPRSTPMRLATGNQLSRSSTITVSANHRRTPSGSGLPGSGQTSPSTNRRRTSSPLVMVEGTTSRHTVLPKVGQVPLLVSPPSSIGRVSPTASPTPCESTRRQATASGDGARPSTMAIPDAAEESLLLATNVPIPEDDESDIALDHSFNLMSFSAPLEISLPGEVTKPVSESYERFSPKSTDSQEVIGISKALSSASIDSQLDPGASVVEDALRATAEQAESAAERLLELVEPDEDTVHSDFPPALLLGHGKATPTTKPSKSIPPATPVSRSAAIMRQAALFENSPVHKGRASSLMDVLNDRKNESVWWRKRVSLLRQDNHIAERNHSETLEELRNYTAALQAGKCGVECLKKIAIFCRKNAALDQISPLSTDYGSPTSPSPFLTPSSSIASLQMDVWSQNKSFEHLLNSLLSFMDAEIRSEEELQYCLIILWEMLEQQGPYFDSREGDIFNLLLNLRYSNKPSVLEATTIIRDLLVSRIEPVYGLTTMHASLRGFQNEDLPSWASADVKAGTYAFGLIALGKFILRLPAEIAEEELPRIKATLISALNDRNSLVVRESAAATIIAAHLVLRDETHLFMLLDGLADEKKNLLAYLFDKHGATGISSTVVNNTAGVNGVDRLEKEMRRLDHRTSTPSRLSGLPSSR